MNDRGFAQIRRTLRPHLAKMSSSAVKLYLWLHLTASWKGKERGTVHANYLDIAVELGWSVREVKRIMAELQSHYIKIVQSGNQYRPTIIRILRYDKRASANPVPSTRAGDKNVPGDVPSTVPSTLEIANTDAGSSASYKVLEGSRSKAAAAAPPKPEDSVWGYLGIDPCGAPKFQQLIEIGWSFRNGTPPLDVIETAINGWLAVEGEAGKRGLAPLFHALGQIRQRARERSVPVEEPIHVLTGDEIPA